LRGFRKPHQQDYLANDLGKMLLAASRYDLKEEVVCAQTPFQRIDIYDASDAHDANSTSDQRPVYEGHNPQSIHPNRCVFLDGVLQSELQGVEARGTISMQSVKEI